MYEVIDEQIAAAVTRGRNEILSEVARFMPTPFEAVLDEDKDCLVTDSENRVQYRCLICGDQSITQHPLGVFHHPANNCLWPRAQEAEGCS